MKFYNGDKLEIVLKPSQAEVENLVKTARALMLKKMDDWVMDQLTIEQLKNCIVQFQSEIDKRENPEEKLQSAIDGLYRGGK